MCLDIQVKDLNSDDGVETLIIKLKSLFAKDTIKRQSLLTTNLRPIDMNTIDFINAFERLYNNLKSMIWNFPQGYLLTGC